MFLCERRFTPFSFLSGSSSCSNRPTKPPSSASAYGDFEDSLCRRLRLLLPPPSPEAANEAMPLAYLSRSVDLLTSTHAEAAQLLRGHDLAADGHPAVLSAYLDISAEILEFCNAASAEVERLLRRRLLLEYALQLLANGARVGRSGVWRIDREKKVIIDWEEGEEGEDDPGPKLGRSLYRKSVIGGALIFPGKGDKYSGAPGGRQFLAFRKALFAVEAVFRLVRSILLAFLFPAAVSPAAVTLGIPGIPDDLAWAGLYKELQAGISVRSDTGHLPLILELEAVKSRRKDLIGTIYNIDTPSGAAVRALENAVDDLTRGLEGVSESVTGLFRSTLHVRDVTIRNLRTGLRKCK